MKTLKYIIAIKRILALIAATAALLALTTSCLLSMLLDDEPSGSSNYKGILNAGRDQGLSIRPVCD